MDPVPKSCQAGTGPCPSSLLTQLYVPLVSCAGLYRFEKRFPERIFDVGIAEQHAVTFAAGMACEGMIPMATIYSSFLQRGYDQVVHDVALQNLPGGFGQVVCGLVCCGDLCVGIECLGAAQNDMVQVQGCAQIAWGRR